MLSVMLVDDDPTEGELLSAAVAQEHLRVRVDQILDGETALRELEQRAARHALPDLILLDINLPRLDGHGFLERYPNREVPIVAYSSSTLRSDVDRMRRSACSAYVEKPRDFVGLRAFLQSLREWFLDGRPLPSDLSRDGSAG